jgi:protein farnesyltransferase/geranylgeranyltransferase type-1 subunit alpha
VREIFGSQQPWITLSATLGWTDLADMKLVPQDNGSNPVVSIDYCDDFPEVMDYFHTLYLTREHITRALHNTITTIELNLDNYTVSSLTSLPILSTP